MKTSRSLMLLALLVLLGVATTGVLIGSPRPPPDLVIANARLIDGTGAVYDRVVLTIRENRIQAIVQGELEEKKAPLWDNPDDITSGGRMLGLTWEDIQEYRLESSAAAANPERTIINADGRTIMPGLIDTHVHLMDCATITDEQTLAVYTTTALQEKLSAYLTYGVTTIKSMGDPEEAILQIRDRLACGTLIGPRLFVVGPMLTFPECHGHTVAALLAKSAWAQAQATVELTSEEDARKTVQRLARKGVDGIHLDGYAFGLRVPKIRMGGVSQDILQALLEEAHQQRLRVTVETADEEVVKCLIEMGVNGVEHGVTCQRLRSDRLQTWLGIQCVSYVPTLNVYATGWPEYLDAAMANLKQLADVPWIQVVLGTDTFGDRLPGLTTIQEMELMVQAGLTPAQVIQAATRDAAAHLGQLHEFGTIQVGKRADLIMVNGDPLKDISALRHVDMVIKDGRVVVKASTDKWSDDAQ